MDLTQLVALLRTNSRALLTWALVVVGLVSGFTLLSPMDFQARGRLYLGELDAENAPSSAHLAELDLSGGEPGDLGSELEILQSESLITRAVLESGLNVSIAPTGFRKPRYWQWLFEARNPALLDVAARELRAVGTFVHQDLRRDLECQVRFVTGTKYEVWSAQRLLGQGRLGEAAHLQGLDLTLLPGARHRPKAGARYDLRVTPLGLVVREVLKVLGVSVATPVAHGEPSKVVALEFVHHSPLLAASFLEKLMHGYLDARQAWKSENATVAEAFVSRQLESMRKELDTAERSLAEYRSNTRVVLMSDQAKAMIEQIGKFEEQRVAASLKVAALADMKRALGHANARFEAYLLGEADDVVLEGLAATLSEERQELASLEQRFHDTAPDVRQQRAQVDAQLTVIKNYVTNRLARAQENLSALGKIIGQFEEKLKTVPGAELGIAQLARESDVYSKMYSYLLERQQQVAIVKASTISKNRILDPPQVPSREHSPRLAMRLVLALLGIALGVFALVLRRLLASTLESESDVLRSVGGRKILAFIPHRSYAKPADMAPVHDLHADERGSPFVEAVRMLRASLPRPHGDERGAIILVTSPLPGDGKTTCVLALASMLAADGKRLLVVDADLRKPSHHVQYGTALEPGLGNVLRGQIDARNAEQPLSLTYGRLSTLSAGTPAFIDLLSSERLAETLADARARFDFVLLDAPSFPLVADAFVLAEHADCLLSVLRLGATPCKLAAEHVQRLAPHASYHAIVVNDVATPRAYGPVASYFKQEPPESPRQLRRRVATTKAFSTPHDP